MRSAKDNASQAWRIVEHISAIQGYRLPAAATVEQLHVLEQICFKMPASFHAVYRTHDGIGETGLLPVSSIIQAWQAAHAYPEWNPHLIPLRMPAGFLSGKRLPENALFLDVGYPAKPGSNQVAVIIDGSVVPIASDLCEALASNMDLWGLSPEWSVASALSPQETATHAWGAVEGIIAWRAGEVATRLPTGIMAVQLDEAERLLGVSLPPVVRELYMLHNGLGRVGWLMSVEEILRAWRFLTTCAASASKESIEAAQGVRADWWNEKWIPVTSDCAGNHYCLDLAPDDDGLVGQVVSFWHDSPERQVVGKDLCEFLILNSDLE